MQIRFPFRFAAAALAAFVLNLPMAAQAQTADVPGAPSAPAMAASPDGSRLFAIDAAGRLEIFAVTPAGPEISVALEIAAGGRVALAAPSNRELVMVSQTTQTVSVVDVASESPIVVRSFPIGGGSLDAVFAQAGMTPLEGMILRMKAGDATALLEMRERLSSGDSGLIGEVIDAVIGDDGLLTELIDVVLDLLGDRSPS
jgi:hypothetical protein